MSQETRRHAIERLTSIVSDLERSGLSLHEASDWFLYLSAKRSAWECARQKPDDSMDEEQVEEFRNWSTSQEIQELCDMEIDDSSDSITQRYDDIGKIGEEFDPGYKLPVIDQEII